MSKNIFNGWICGLTNGESEYRIGDVTYTVGSRFEETQSNNTIKNRFAKAITNDFIDLTEDLKKYKLVDEYVCSAAGEED